MDRRTLLLAAALAVPITAVIAVWALAHDPRTRAGGGGPGTELADAGPTPQGHAGLTHLPASIRWIAAGGGAEPESNQVSLEQDLDLARQVLGDEGGVLLHAGGTGVDGVQVLAERGAAPDLVSRLGDLFDPRQGREARYRPTTLDGTHAATLAHLEQALDTALAEPGGSPLLLYLAGHGEPGDMARDNLVRLWGGWGLTVGDLATRLQSAPSPRPVRLVVAACFGGGFADLAFADADPAQGPASTLACGLFATTWDRQSSGCDPDPNRSVQEGYSLHFLNALRGWDRDGKPLPPGALDLDGDQQVSLLEAHTRVRIASRAIDVPTTTSERWLRMAAPTGGREAELLLPEEEAVIGELGRILGITGLDDAERRVDELEQGLSALDEERIAQGDEIDARWAPLRIALLERWPVLDDPWHPQFAATIDRWGPDIERFLDSSQEAEAFRLARNALPPVEQDEREVQLALTMRLARSLETVSLARRLRQRGGPDWTRYEALLTCERGAIGRGR